ncbi:MAG: coenzyme F420-0:L-glutamate ligase [Oscillospiraceae bacterium]|nr:coenzyme F420-0:L-glutamate ligase [Oscillospiraceae bacterium]
MEIPFTANEGKSLVIDTDYGNFARYPIKTHVITKDDTMEEIIDKYVKDYLDEGDTIIISEKIVAITQGRAFPIEEIKVSLLAKILSRFVIRTSYGVGLAAPQSMELCIRDVGRIKVIFAAICAGIGKLFGKRGVFYNICGMKARAIDGPSKDNVPPYDHYAKMAPDKPDEAAKHLMDYTGVDVVIIDANDIGLNVLGKSRKDDDLEKFATQVFRDNPLDQGLLQTPIAIVRKAS